MKPPARFAIALIAFLITVVGVRASTNHSLPHHSCKQAYDQVLAFADASMAGYRNMNEALIALQDEAFASRTNNDNVLDVIDREGLRYVTHIIEAITAILHSDTRGHDTTIRENVARHCMQTDTTISERHACFVRGEAYIKQVCAEHLSEVHDAASAVHSLMAQTYRDILDAVSRLDAAIDKDFRSRLAGIPQDEPYFSQMKLGSGMLREFIKLAWRAVRFKLTVTKLLRSHLDRMEQIREMMEDYVRTPLLALQEESYWLTAVATDVQRTLTGNAASQLATHSPGKPTEGPPDASESAAPYDDGSADP